MNGSGATDKKGGRVVGRLLPHGLWGVSKIVWLSSINGAKEEEVEDSPSQKIMTPNYHFLYLELSLPFYWARNIGSHRADLVCSLPNQLSK